MTRTNKIIYWITTGWLALGMVSTGIVQLLRSKSGAGGLTSVTALGYPVYLLTWLGVWKILGVVAILIPGRPVLKEWAYAGFFFLTSGAIFSHIAAGNPVSEIFPAFLLLVLTLLSCWLRPAGRKIISANFSKEKIKQLEEIMPVEMA